MPVCIFRVVISYEMNAKIIWIMFFISTSFEDSIFNIVYHFPHP